MPDSYLFTTQSSHAQTTRARARIANAMVKPLAVEIARVVNGVTGRTGEQAFDPEKDVVVRRGDWGARSHNAPGIEIRLELSHQIDSMAILSGLRPWLEAWIAFNDPLAQPSCDSETPDNHCGTVDLLVKADRGTGFSLNTVTGKYIIWDDNDG